MRTAVSTRVAIIGAGIAGATCARLLAGAGHDVQVFDKARGVGGRMATRRAQSQRAQALPMLPGWTLMGVTADAQAAPAWDVAWPTQGPLAWIVRNVQAVLQQALAQWFGRPLTWHHAAVHRWRYASVPRADAAAAAVDTGRWCWDASLRLGVCGDALGGAGVEGAWTSGRALAATLIDNTLGPQALGGAHSSCPGLTEARKPS